MHIKKRLFSICFSIVLSVSSVSATLAQTFSSTQITQLSQNILQNQTIDGDFTIPASMGEQQIVLEHVNIHGKLKVLGGSDIQIKGCNIHEIEVQKDITIHADITSKINTVFLSCSTAHLSGDGYQKVISSATSTTLDADIETVESNAAMDLKLLSNADIQTLQVSEKGATLHFAENAQVDTCILYGKTKITGMGGIIHVLTTYANGVETDIKPDELLMKENANKITYTTKETVPNKPATKEHLILDVDNEGFNAKGKTYQNVVINARDASLSNIVVQEDITLKENIKNSGATLTNVTAKDIAIYGGKEAITLQNTTVQNDIISYRNDRTPITLVFDANTTVGGNVVIRGNTILKGNTIKNVLVEQYFGRKLELDSNVKKLQFKTTAVETQINKKVETLFVDSVKNTLKLHMKEGSIIEELYANANVEITGTGTIQKIITDKEVHFAPTITVKEMTDSFVSVTDIEGVPTTINKGKETPLFGIVIPYQANKQSIRWSIKEAGNTGATISNGNVLTAYREGTVVVTAQIRDAIQNTQTFTKDFTIQIKDEFADFVNVEDVAITVPTTWDIDEPLSLAADVVPSNATNSFITWSIKDAGTTRARLFNNQLTATRTGVVTVVATIEKGTNGIFNFTKEFQINIIPIEKKFINVEHITLNTPNICKAGEILPLSGTVEPSNANVKTIQWHIVDAGKTGAYIQNHTNLYTREPGNIVISATIYNGLNFSSKNYYQEFNITVK